MAKKLEPIQYYQTDKRWSNNDYSAKGEKTTIKAEGCGVACSAMVIASLADKKVTPATTAAWSLKNGYKALRQGTYYSYFKPQMAEYGIKCEMMNSKNAYHDKNAKVHNEVKNALQNGDWVIVVFGVGEYTNSGHYCLMYGMDGDNVLIRDPWNTKPNLLKKNFDDAAYQAKYYWKVTLPEKYKEDDEVIVRENIIVDDKEFTVEMINKDGFTFLKTRDVASIFNMDVSNKGGTPILTSKNK